MIKKEVLSGANGRVMLLDSISAVAQDDEEKILVSSSHGGVAAGEYACRFPLKAVFFNDAGVGKNSAGIAALKMLEDKGIPAGTVSHMSARIGDSVDMWENGVVSHLNEKAVAMGFVLGERLQDAIKKIINS